MHPSRIDRDPSTTIDGGGQSALAGRGRRPAIDAMGVPHDMVGTDREAEEEEAARAQQACHLLN